MSDEEINRYALMMEALNEIKQEIDSTRQVVKPTPALPSLNETLADFGPMPQEALFLGVAADDLPVLLNLHDPVPGPVLDPPTILARATGVPSAPVAGEGV